MFWQFITIGERAEDMDHLQHRLNEIGQQGWELVSFTCLDQDSYVFDY